MESSESVQPLDPAVESASTKRDRIALGWFAAGAAVGAIAAIGVMLILTAARTPSPSAAAPAGDDRPFAPKVVARPANTRGVDSAPVTIIEYGDFNCGYCRKFHDETLQRVIDDYVQTGKARFSYKHFPFLTQSSPWKAEAAECAAEQGGFWEYHEMLFDGTIPSAGDEPTVRRELVEAAEMLKLDAQAFKACMDSTGARERVNADASEGRRLGMSGTPSFLIGGRPLVGAQPYEAFKQAIDAALDDAP
jgi:protein-disulfide isomerase